MTNEERKQVVLESLAAYVTEGVDALLPYLHEDIVWEEDPDWPDGGVWHGHDEVRQAFRERLETTRIDPELEDLEVHGDRVLVFFRWTAVGEASGATAVISPAAIYDFRGELVARLRFYLDRERARAEFRSTSP